jgi:glycolate oxidase iron-sulfur subunit
MREMYAGKLDLSETFVDEMYFCLDCQACETACPAGVKYGELVEETRGIIASQKLDPPSVRWIRSLVLKGVLGSAKRTQFFARILRSIQRIGLLEALEKSGLMSLLPPSLAAKLAMLPEISESFFDESGSGLFPATGPRRGSVAFLSGCMMNVAFSGVHRDAVEVLKNGGYDVHLPKGHACCGSLLAHYGGGEDAKSLARQTIDAFERLESDAIVVDSAGCAAYMKEYGRILQDDATYSARAARISQKTREFSEFVQGAHINPPTGDFNKSVTYHEACHLVHTQKVSRQPREIIQSIPGIKFVELPEASWCCGSAGVYNVVRYDDSMKFLERKIDNLRSTGAQIVVTGNPGCHIQLQYGLKKWGVPMEVMHPATLLRKACGM